MAFWMFMVAIGLAVAIVRSTRAGWRAAKGVYQRRRSEGHGALGAIAAMTAALWHGTPLAIRAARNEWPNGWRAGRRYAYQRFNRPLPEDLAEPEPAPQPAPSRTPDGHLVFGTDPTDPTGVAQCVPCQGTGFVGGKPCPDCQARQQLRNADYDGRPGLVLVVDNTHPAANPGEPTTPPTTKGVPMPTAAGRIEVLNVDTLKLWAETMRDTAVHDLEDARADAIRGKEDLEDAELAHARAQQLKFGLNILLPLKSMIDTHRANLDACQQRVLSADHKRVQAAQLLDEINKHLAVAEAGQAAGGMAEREAYTRV